MKAWVLEEFKGPSSIKLKTINRYPLKNNEIRVKVQACGINNKDIFISKGLYYRKIKAPIILGSDISGTVIELGDCSLNYKLNDRVIISPAIGCGTCHDCSNGEENNCDNYKSILGGFAEEIVVSANSVIKIPDSLTYVEAAALPISYITAWNMLNNKVKVKETDTVLIWGAASGVGTAAIVLMKDKEKIIAIAGGKKKIDILQGIGITKVIDYQTEDVNEKVLSYTNGDGVDIIFDPVGKAAWNDNLLILKNNGKHVNCARNTGSVVEMDLGLLFSKQITVYGAKSGSKKDLTNVLSYLIENNQKPIVSKVFPFEQAKEALEFLESGIHFGKVVLSNTK